MGGILHCDSLRVDGLLTGEFDMSRAIGSVRLLVVVVVVVFIVGRAMLQCCNAAYGSDTHIASIAKATGPDL